MLPALKDFSFSPWQSVTLKFGGIALAILFLAVIIVGLIQPQKKKAEDKWHSAFCWVGLTFMSVFTILVAITLSFVVEEKLGWQLSLLAGASVILGAISLGAGFIVSFTKIPMKYTFLWGTAGIASFVSILSLSIQTLNP